MALKRKRSISEMHSSPCSSTFSSPPSNGSIIFQISPRATVPTPAHLHSRTMKRFRDSRPSQDIIHQRTLNLLFSAQNQPDVPELPQYDIQSPTPQPIPAPATQQQSLHRFWNISSQPTIVNTIEMQQTTAPTGCEDCGAELDTNMEMDASACGSESSTCSACGKYVCFSCSVSNLGQEKRCLKCAKRTTVWANGNGWSGAGFEMI